MLNTNSYFCPAYFGSLSNLFNISMWPLTRALKFGPQPPLNTFVILHEILSSGAHAKDANIISPGVGTERIYQALLSLYCSFHSGGPSKRTQVVFCNPSSVTLWVGKDKVNWKEKANCLQLCHNPIWSGFKSHLLPS